MNFKRLFARMAAVGLLIEPLTASALAPPADPAAPAGASDSASRPPKPERPLAALLSDEDYPMQAIARREQGMVDLRFSIDAEGRATRCFIISSSGSATLDSASCQLIGQRARFQPARDEQGRPVAGTYGTRIRWVLPKSEQYEALELAYTLWARCALDETARLSRTRLALSDVTRKALGKCGREETEVVRVLRTELLVIPVKNSLRQAIATQLARSRRAQEGPANK